MTTAVDQLSTGRAAAAEQAFQTSGVVITTNITKLVADS